MYIFFENGVGILFFLFDQTFEIYGLPFYFYLFLLLFLCYSDLDLVTRIGRKHGLDRIPCFIPLF